MDFLGTQDDAIFTDESIRSIRRKNETVFWPHLPLTLDLTWNTDFAQVEADNVQVNLDRFSLFFPEKRDFSLERSRLFAFGDAGQTQLFLSRPTGRGIAPGC